MALPSGKPPPPNLNDPKPKLNHIDIDAKGQILLNNAVVPDAKLMDTFRGLKAADPDPKVVVKAADSVEYQRMIKVLDALQQLDITKIGLATQ